MTPSSHPEARGRWIVLSPHLDDGPLSVGGLIAGLRSHVAVEVWSLFCNAPFRGPYSPLAQWLHGASGGRTGSRLSRQRRAEDKRACRLLGAGARHFGWVDTPYRKTSAGRYLYETAQVSEWHEGDAPLVDSISAGLKAEIKPDDVVLAPLGLGHHVDHLITRHVADHLSAERVMYYPEIPYIEMFEEELEGRAERLTPVGYKVTTQQVDLWIDAVRSYATQMGMLEEAAGPIPEMIRRRASSSQLYLYRQAGVPAIDLSRFGLSR